MTDVVKAIRDYIDEKVLADCKYPKSPAEFMIYPEAVKELALDAVLFALSQRPVSPQVVNTFNPSELVASMANATIELGDFEEEMIKRLTKRGYHVFAPETFMIPTSSSGINIWIDEQVFNLQRQCKEMWDNEGTPQIADMISAQEAKDIARGAAACVAKDRNALIGNLRAAGYQVIEP